MFVNIFMFSKNQLLISLILSTIFLLSSLFIPDLIFIIFFRSLDLNF